MVRYNSSAPPAGFRRVKGPGSGKSYEDIMRMLDESKINKVLSKIKKSERIDRYIPNNWEVEKKVIYDRAILLERKYSNLNGANVVRQALSKDNGLLEAMQTIKVCQYITKKDKSNTHIYVLFFYGEEKEAFIKVMEKKALFYPNIPHVVNGRIIGRTKKSDILDVCLNYDREYGLYLKKLFEEGKIDGEHHLSKSKHLLER